LATPGANITVAAFGGSVTAGGWKYDSRLVEVCPQGGGSVTAG
jgi:hypothetical protein